MAAKGNYKSEDEKKKWMELEVMSSDQSGDDGDQIIMVHPLPWLSAEVVAFNPLGPKIAKFIPCVIVADRPFVCFNSM